MFKFRSVSVHVSPAQAQNKAARSDYSKVYKGPKAPSTTRWVRIYSGRWGNTCREFADKPHIAPVHWSTRLVVPCGGCATLEANKIGDYLTMSIAWWVGRQGWETNREVRRIKRLHPGPYIYHHKQSKICSFLNLRNKFSPNFFSSDKENPQNPLPPPKNVH